LFGSASDLDRPASVNRRDDLAATGGAAVARPPLPPSSFVGKQADLDELGELLGRTRLITLTGPPGVGKTRLAHELADRYRHGAVFVNLAPVEDPALVDRTLSVALAVAEAPGQSLIETVTASLRKRASLLVLDNCEHLLNACRELVARLLEGCPELTVLATSREPLTVDSEQAWPVAPLAVPARSESTVPEALMQCPSVRLFVERAGAAQPGFALNSYVAPAVAEICRRLDGIPLALELAAARVDMLTPGQLAARLDDRFDLTSGGRAGAAGRHETLAAALDWSYELLSSPERALLRRLSVFAGGFDAGAVEGVCAGDEVAAEACGAVLAVLVSKSLVAVDAGGASTPRYRLLETVRAYASDRLEHAGEAVRLREAHAGFYVELAEALEPRLTARGQARALERLDCERDNLRRALDWCLGHSRSEWALRLAGSLVLFWRMRSRFSEGRELLQAAVSTSNGGAPRLRAKAMWGAGFLTMMAGDPERAAPVLESSLAAFREEKDLQGASRALLILANCNQSRAGAIVLPLLEESAALARAAGDAWCLAHALGVAGFSNIGRGEFAVARGLFEECLAIAREAQDNQGLRFGLIGLGSVAVLQGDYRSAQKLLEEGLATACELGEAFSQAEALRWLGELALDRGDYPRAHELLEESLGLTPDVAPREGVIGTLLLLGRVAHAAGDPGGARRQFGEVVLRGGDAMPLALAWRGDLAVDVGDREEGRRLFERALSQARGWGQKNTIARALQGLGRLARDAGNSRQSEAFHIEALQLQREIGAAPSIVASLEALAGLAAITGDHLDAARLVGAAEALRTRDGYAPLPWESARYKADVALARAGLGVAEFEQAFSEGGMLSLDDAAALACRRSDASGRAPGGWAALTERERQVAELAAEGLTNPEIAERLAVTRWTVKFHLAHTFSKLGVTRRSELVREVSRGWAGNGAPDGA
jgi:predicted ATPase/DNA-binding CsgD family transcriptional regulator